jgi:hypothetical protein
MSIRPSAAADIRPLVDALGSADEIRREAAIARLAIIGPRAVDRLAAAYETTREDRSKRTAILRVLEAIGDPRAIPLARDALTQGGDVAIAAAGALRALLDSPIGGAAAESLDALMAVALDRQADRRTRIAAFEALDDMPEAVREQVAAALTDDPDLSVKVSAGQSEAASADAVWQDAIDGRLPDEAAGLRDSIRARAASTALSALQKLVDAVRAREAAQPDSPRAPEWVAVRGTLHQALALRGSTVALYDLRETIAAATAPLPTTFLTALHVIGDESCLEAIAAAYAHDASASEEDERWRQQLAAAFQAIVKREKIKRTSGTLKRIASRWPDAAGGLSKTSRTTPRRKTPART